MKKSLESMNTAMHICCDYSDGMTDGGTIECIR